MYEDITYEKILDRMLARVPDKFDKREGSVIWDTHSPTAIELQILYIELDRILREAYGDTASREFLILRCRERGIIPHEATKTVLKGEFVPADIDVGGQRFNIGALNYAVGEKIADGEYRVVCETAGKTGNQFLGAMTPMEYIKGLKTAELTEILIPGRTRRRRRICGKDILRRLMKMPLAETAQTIWKRQTQSPVWAGQKLPGYGTVAFLRQT